jgi:hypothetical protein
MLTGTPRRRAPRPRRCRTAVLGGFSVVLLGVLAGCSAQRPSVPARPALPAVVFVPPCDPQASIGMTEAGVAQLRSRDEAWRTHVEILETIIRGER